LTFTEATISDGNGGFMPLPALMEVKVSFYEASVRIANC